MRPIGPILPGMMNTPMIHAAVIAAYGRSAEEMVRRHDAQCPMGHMGDAWDVAYAALFLASDENSYRDSMWEIPLNSSRVPDGGNDTEQRPSPWTRVMARSW
jgi:NAD(P)-dependent dehydrogenase (short-subunit alcohol dehydrogenase family)